LRNHQERAAGVDRRAVHLAFCVFEDAEIGDFPRQLTGAIFIIGVADAEKNTEPGTDRTDSLVAHNRAGLTDSLDHSAHAQTNSSFGAKIAMREVVLHKGRGISLPINFTVNREIG
jgi:hypothetical protein